MQLFFISCASILLWSALTSNWKQVAAQTRALYLWLQTFSGVWPYFLLLHWKKHCNRGEPRGVSSLSEGGGLPFTQSSLLTKFYFDFNSKLCLFLTPDLQYELFMCMFLSLIIIIIIKNLYINNSSLNFCLLLNHISIGCKNLFLSLFCH